MPNLSTEYTTRMPKIWVSILDAKTIQRRFGDNPENVEKGIVTGNVSVSSENGFTYYGPDQGITHGDATGLPAELFVPILTEVVW